LIGWKARLGVIVPGGNFVLEPEFYKMTPEGVSVHFSRLTQGSISEAHFQVMFDEAARAANELRLTDAIGFGCTSASLYKGPDYTEELIRRMQEASGVPCTTTSTAVVNALREMEIRKFSVATPYEDWVNQAEKRFLEENGFKVCNIEGLNLRGSEISDLPLSAAYRLARKVNCVDADGIFISCTAFRTIEILDDLESDLGKPVISSNQALMWMLLKIVGVRKAIHGFGQLLTKL
jgi:maleate isomerase